MKLLLHACCGPCSLEPTRLLREAGHSIHIAYINSNIHPYPEYQRRFETLNEWACTEELPVIEGTYDAQVWEESISPIIHDAQKTQRDRCRACYRMRLEELAATACDQGFEAISTTLSVSPYQFTDVIEEELIRAGKQFGIQALFEDFRPYYPAATQKSRRLGMYRQDYCGCHFSKAEAAQMSEDRKRERAEQKEKVRKEKVSTAQETALKNEKLAEKQAYAKKQATKKAALKAYKESERKKTPKEDRESGPQIQEDLA